MGKRTRIAFLLLLGVTVAFAFAFWSRYPQLNEKALMAQSGTLADLMSVWPIIEILPTHGFWQKVFYSGINWIYDNKKGMLAGLFIGSIFLTVFNYLSVIQSQNRWLNSFFGFAVGSPLGVCVNCAAPIFKGVLQSRRIETAFSVMLSSPSMNAIVLTMTFSLFPVYMGVVKVLFTFCMVFLFVPVLSYLLRNEKLRDLSKIESSEQNSQIFQPSEVSDTSTLQSIGGALKDLVASFLYLSLRTVPLMFLAGFLGALLSHVLPVDSFIGKIGLFETVIFCVVVLLLPVPMAFDIMLANALYQIGLEPDLVLVMLCGLGITSMFSLMIVWQSASLKWSLAIFASCALLLLPVLQFSESWHRRFYFQPNVEKYMQWSADFGLGQISAIERELIDQSNEKNSSVVVEDSLNQYRKIRTIDNLSIFERKLHKRRSKHGGQKIEGPQSKPLFEKREGGAIGLNHGFRYGIRDYPDPFWIGRGTAAGDFNQDGWVDIAFGTDVGISLYQNQLGRFSRIDLKNSFIKKQKVYAVALVDINNDGWLDLFFSTYLNGNHVLLNENGKFSQEIVPIPNNRAVITVSPSFADFDNNGFLDIYNGNMALGIVSGFYRFSNRRNNSLVYNHNLRFTELELDSQSGETMSTLAADFNDDGIADIYNSNDFNVPDYFFLSQAEQKWRRVRRKQNVLAETPFYSMSVDRGDFDNDGLFDLLISGTISMAEGLDKKVIDGVRPEVHSQEKWGKGFCQSIKDSVVRKNCELVRKSDHLKHFDQRKSLSVDYCQSIKDPIEKQACLMSTMWTIVTNNLKSANCYEDFSQDLLLLKTCQLLMERGEPYGKKSFPQGIQQNANGNYLYKQASSMEFTKLSREQFPHPGGWTWNTQFSDYNNDGYLDVFGAEGAVRTQGYGWNTFMLNQAGENFLLVPFSNNATDNFNLFSFVNIDYDNDGDIDVIGNSSTGPVQVYENVIRTPSQSLFLELRDHRSNRFAIGAIVTLHLDNGQKLVREIKASGGYQSYSPSHLHFAFASDRSVEKLIIRWPDRIRSQASIPMKSHHFYKIVRN